MIQAVLVASKWEKNQKNWTNNLHFPFVAETRFSFVLRKKKWKMHIVEFSSLADG